MARSTVTRGTSLVSQTQRDFVNSIARGLEVIRSFDRDHASMTLSDVAQRTSLTRATARRILLTLVELGYMHFDGRHFSLSPRIMELGYSYLSSMDFPDAVQPYIQEASRAAHESCSVSVLSDTDIVYVARVHTEHIISISLSVGSHLPAHITSMGRVLLAHLPPDELDEIVGRIQFNRYTAKAITSPARLHRILKDVAERGHSIVEEELETGLSSIAVPILNRNGMVHAAVNFGGPSARLRGPVLRRKYLPILEEAAKNISGALPY
jgi:IclR family pca regulon transcriptional regulator